MAPTSLFPNKCRSPTLKFLNRNIVTVSLQRIAYLCPSGHITYIRYFLGIQLSFIILTNIYRLLSETIKGQDWLFKDFFARGTIHEIQQLLLKEYILIKSLLASASDFVSTSPFPSPYYSLGPVEHPIITPIAVVERNNV